MKIGVDASRLTNKNRTGTENYLYYLLQALSKKDTKHEFVLYFKEEPSREFIREITNGKKNFSYKVLPSLGSWTQVGLALEIFKNTPDILFCSWHTMPGINPFWKMQTVATIHDVTGRFIPTCWTTTFANALIAVSSSTKNSIKHNSKIRSPKIHVIHEGFDTSLFGMIERDKIQGIKVKYGISGDYMFFLGSIGPRKNIENMVKAYNSLDTNIDFVLGGAALPGHEKLMELPAKFIGRVPQEELPYLYAGAKLFAFVSNEEGFGIPILEAMASGTPVLTANVSSTKEVAGSAALLVRPDSVQDIASGMEKIIRDTELAVSLSTQGLARVKDFSWDKAAEKTLMVFEEVYAKK
ncbi:glycosyltransferase family 4 protein [candidate division WWE3 bacterium]|mgnify:CR=1 FL=1|jgi:glycosyltransferase involved in cell wall biosynthesis|nr:glycosyltransferase family 4 protein [candidate division WWE3 bacterium]